MKLCYLILALFACAFNAQTQTDSSAVPFVAYWALGDTYHFKVTKIKQQRTNDELEKNDSSQYIASFEVIDSTDKSYKIKWTFENNLVSTYQIPEKFLEKYPEYKRTEIIYTTTETGEFVEIENWEEYGKMMQDVFEALIAEKGGAEKEQLRAVMEYMTAAYSSKESIEGIVFKELRYFHFPFGMQIATSDTIEYQEEFPHIFGGDPVKGRGIMFIESVDFESEYCVLINQTQMDPEQANSLLMRVFRKMGIADEDIEKELKHSEINIHDDNRYAYFYFPGVPALIETERGTTVRLGNVASVILEKTIIELID